MSGEYAEHSDKNESDEDRSSRLQAIKRSRESEDETPVRRLKGMVDDDDSE